MMRIAFVLLGIMIHCHADTQNLKGFWSGELWQEGNAEVFSYELTLGQEGGRLTGKAVSKSQNGSSASFETGGTFSNGIFILQEVRQISPEHPRWCLKHFRLQYSILQDQAVLSGTWEAQGCQPGRVVLRQPLSEKPNLPLAGKFTGQLTQSDRSYGFYFEMRLHEDGHGTSHIQSDGEGGYATHRLQWNLDKENNILSFRELEVIEKSIPGWRWCLKSGQLTIREDPLRLSLNGTWSGYIEGFDDQTGPCAPGELYAEQPKIATPAEPKPVNANSANAVPSELSLYTTQTGRKVEVNRVLEVKNKTLRIRVWDSGTVDGDVCSLFLNGELILKNYRVARKKHETIVRLDRSHNYLILHALNLGSISPNTISVSVDDGTGEKVVILSSNLDTSGAIMIREFTVKE